MRSQKSSTTKVPDGRKDNSRPLKWEEAKECSIHLRLTKKAYDWIKGNGGADVIEKLARGLWK